MASFLSSRTERVRERKVERQSANPLGGVTSKYPGPRNEISRDQNLAWWLRVMPVIKSHRVTFVTAIVLSFVSLVLQVLVPNMLSNDINHTFVQHVTSPSEERYLTAGSPAVTRLEYDSLGRLPAYVDPKGNRPGFFQAAVQNGVLNCDTEGADGVRVYGWNTEGGAE